MSTKQTIWDRLDDNFRPKIDPLMPASALPGIEEGWELLADAIALGDTTTDHGSLSGLGDDDHMQYPLLAGRSTGQTLYGGTASGEDLTLHSTSHATGGSVFFGPDTTNAAQLEIDTNSAFGVAIKTVTGGSSGHLYIAPASGVMRMFNSSTAFDFDIYDGNTQAIHLDSTGVSNFKGGNLYVNGLTTEAKTFGVGTGRTGNGVSNLKLIGDATYTDYGTKLTRSAGVNGVTGLYHRGTGNFNIGGIDASNVNLMTGNSVKLTVEATTGDIGVGNTSPAYRLDVFDTSTVYASRIFNDGNNAGYKGLIIQCGLDSPTANNDCRWIDFNDGNGTARSYIAYNTVSPFAAFYNASDQRLKENVVENTTLASLDRINQIKFFGFDWLPNEDGYKLQSQSMGLVAQQLQPLFPEMVAEDPDGMLMVTEAPLTKHLVKAVQELSQQVKELQNKLKE